MGVEVKSGGEGVIVADRQSGESVGTAFHLHQ